MRSIFIFLFIILGFEIFAQNYSWAYTIKGAYIPVSKTVIDQNDNIFVLGTGSELNYNGGMHQITSATDFIAKYKPNGVLEWIVPINDDSVNYYARRIKINSNGEIILAGSQEGKIYLRKLNGSGTIIWTKQFVIPQAINSHMASLTIDSGNNIIAGGSFATSTCACNVPTNLLIYKLDNSGNLQWSINTVNNLGNIDVTDIACDANNDIILSGAGNNLTFQGSVNQFSLNPGNFLAKYSSSGEPLWARNTDPNLEETYLSCDGTDIYAAGGFKNQINMDGQAFSAASQGSACLFKLNASGNIGWTKTIGDVYAKFSSINIDHNDHTIWLSGGYSSQLNISTLTGNYSFSSPPYFGYNLDFFVLQADASGNWKKINMIETINGQMWGSISNIANGKFAAGGPFWGKAVFSKPNNGKDTLSGPPGNVSYDGILAFFGNGGTATDSKELTISLARMIAYPNPAKDKLTIDPQIQDEYDLEIYDGSGRIIFSDNGITGIREYHSGDDLAPGTYIIKVRSEKCIMTTKVVIQH